MLRSPVRLDDGSVRVEAVTSVAGALLVYPWGTETATPEALSDPLYHEALRGLAITLHHPASGRQSAGDPRVGTVLSARYDSGELIQEWVIYDPAAADAVMSGRLREASDGYRVPAESLVDGEQRRRIPNHVAITDRGRATGTTIRIDEESTMTEEQIKAMLAPIMERLAALEADDEDIVDEKEGEMTERPEDIADRLLVLHRRADALGVVIPVEHRTEAAISRHLATSLGGDAARCDSVDYCAGVIASAKSPTAADRFVLRADSTHSPC